MTSRGLVTRSRWLAASTASLVCSAALLASVGASAQAATALGQTGSPGTCSDNFGQVQDAGGSAPAYTVPVDGVITSFSAASDAGSHQVKLLVLQPVPGTTYNVVAKSDPGTFTAAGVQTFSTQLSVKAGQVIGDWGYICGFPTSNAADHFHYFSGGDPALGVPHAFPTAGPPSVRADLSATLEPASAGDTGQRAAALKKCKMKKKKKASKKARKKCRKHAQKLPV